MVFVFVVSEEESDAHALPRVRTWTRRPGARHHRHVRSDLRGRSVAITHNMGRTRSPGDLGLHHHYGTRAPRVTRRTRVPHGERGRIAREAGQSAAIPNRGTVSRILGRCAASGI